MDNILEQLDKKLKELAQDLEQEIKIAASFEAAEQFYLLQEARELVARAMKFS